METRKEKDLKIEELENILIEKDEQIEELKNKVERLKNENLRINTEKNMFCSMIKSVTEYY